MVLVRRALPFTSSAVVFTIDPSTDSTATLRAIRIKHSFQEIKLLNAVGLSQVASAVFGTLGFSLVPRQCSVNQVVGSVTETLFNSETRACMIRYVDLLWLSFTR